MNKKRVVAFLLILLPIYLGMAWLASSQVEPKSYLPVVLKPLPTPTPPPPDPGAMVEFRGLWVTRFDWTLNVGDRNPAKIDEIVNNAANAGFNAILFQVRGTADAFYNSNVEPWSDRLTGTLGQNPGWDPLAHMIQKAHERGIQVHAYINVYPVWAGCNAPPNGTDPQHLYYRLQQSHGVTGSKLNGLQWNTSDQVVCSSYQRVSPASIFFDNHLLSVATDLVTRYDVDGLHLDHIRYDSGSTSCDPVSEGRYSDEGRPGTSCFGYNGKESYADWQRRQVNGTVEKLYDEIVPLKPKLWLSAAVWPIYINYQSWNWPSVLEGYVDFYQDSKAWVSGSYIDSISPMIYPATFNCPDNSFWTQSRWNTLVSDFQAARNGRYVIPGIGGGYCSFSEIESRINMARSIGTAGHAIFSYSGLLAKGWFDELANGPYSQPAVVPQISWHP